MRIDPGYPVRPRRGEAGSAYIIALLVLVVLTIIGLALTLTTQFELQIGANERVTSRTFYAADSGVSVAVSKALVTHDYDKLTMRMNGGAALAALSDQIELTPMLPILEAPCNLCQINQGNDFYAINHAVSSVATRLGMDGATPVSLAQQQVTVMVDVQPWQHSPQSMAAALDEDALQKIHF